MPGFRIAQSTADHGPAAKMPRHDVVYMHAHTHMYIYIYMHVIIYIYIFMHTHVHIFIHVHARMHAWAGWRMDGCE